MKKFLSPIFCMLAFGQQNDLRSVVLVVDEAFGHNGTVRGPVGYLKAVVQKSNGALVAAGHDDRAKKIVVQYHNNGVLDTTFGPDGSGIARGDIGIFNAITCQQDDKIVAVGTNRLGTDLIPFCTRYNSDGSTDNRFTVSNLPRGSRVCSIIALAPSETVVLAGFSQNIQSILNGYTQTGTPAPTFGNYKHGKNFRWLLGSQRTGKALPLPDIRFKIVRYLSDGSILVYAEKETLLRYEVPVILHYFQDGTQDMTFGNNGVCNVPSDAQSSPEPILETTPDGAFFTVFFSQTQAAIVRKYDRNGMHDQSFQDVTFGRETINALVVTPTGLFIAKNATGSHFSSIALYDFSGNQITQITENRRDEITTGIDIQALLYNPEDHTLLAAGKTSEEPPHFILKRYKILSPEEEADRQAAQLALQAIIDAERDAGAVESCAICFEENIPFSLLEKTQCGHYFHPACLAQWQEGGPTETRNSCPLCRAPLNLQADQ